MKNNKVTCRPCKEQPGKWEIQDQNGNVQQQHFASKDECVNVARRMAAEASCELSIEETNNTNNTTTQAKTTSNSNN